MTPAQHDSRNRFLAERVLGCPPSDHVLPDFSCLNSNIDNLLDKIEKDGWRWRMQWDGNDIAQHLVCLLHPDHAMVSDRSYQLTEALCLAIARAYGYKEE